MRQLPVIDSKTYSPWSNISTVGLELAASCAQAGFLDWASNLAQLRHLKAQKRRTAKRAPPPAAAAPRRPSKYARRLFIWGFIGTNVAISIAWARAADEAAVTGMTMRQSAAASAALRVPGGLSHMADNVALTAQGLREGRWWTLLTCGASHFAPAYLIVNVCEFYTWASRCFDLGLGPGAVAGIMIGSTVCCGLAGLAGEDPGKPAVLMGASGIVSGLRESSISIVFMCSVVGSRRVRTSLPWWPDRLTFEATLRGSRRFSWSP